jgi:hypothetical protein
MRRFWQWDCCRQVCQRIVFSRQSSALYDDAAMPIKMAAVIYDAVDVVAVENLVFMSSVSELLLAVSN